MYKTTKTDAMFIVELWHSKDAQNMPFDLKTLRADVRGKQVYNMVYDFFGIL